MKKILCTDIGMNELGKFDLSYNLKLVAGIDEAGRGPLAGPVVCAACIMPLDKIYIKINDSKKLNSAARQELYNIIVSEAISYNVSIIDHTIIDGINILNATKQGMLEALNGLKIKPNILLVDAVKLNTPILTEAVIKGDAKSYNIAAASILAKVTRDKIMEDYHILYPEYMFNQNKGYGTATHIEALKQYGACPIHRKTFIKNFVGGNKNEQA